MSYEFSGEFRTNYIKYFVSFLAIGFVTMVTVAVLLDDYDDYY